MFHCQVLEPSTTQWAPGLGLLAQPSLHRFQCYSASANLQQHKHDHCVGVRQPWVTVHSVPYVKLKVCLQCQKALNTSVWPGNCYRFKNFSSTGFENSHMTTPNPVPGLISFCFHKWSALKWRLPKPPSQHSLPSEEGGKNTKTEVKKGRKKTRYGRTNKLSPHYNPLSFSRFFTVAITQPSICF